MFLSRFAPAWTSKTFWVPSRKLAPVPRRRLEIEDLEGRDLMAAGPFDSPQFVENMTRLLADNGVPLASIALMRNGQTYTWDNSDTIDDTAVFRLGSVSKSFCAAVVMKLAQDRQLNLDDSFLHVLGFVPGQIISGFAPLDGVTRVGAALPAPLFKITIRQLLGMTSGLPMNVPVESVSFPNLPASEKLSQTIYTAGSYASLTFAGQPPYTDGPANVEEQMRFFLYQVSREFAINPVVYDKADGVAKQAANDVILLKPGRFYVYNDTDYALLGWIAETVAMRAYGQNYGEYLQAKILTPMGISAPTANPATNAMVGIGNTRENEAYPTEVFYHTYPNEGPGPSVFPDPTKTAAPYYPTKPNGDPVLLPEPYGGAFFLESHFGEGGLVATPTALVKFFDSLSDSLAGQIGGPLSQSNVKQMVAQPSGPAGHAINGTGWFGLGFAVFPKQQTYNGGIDWFKGGDLPGNSSLLYHYHDGTTWAATFNIKVLSDSKFAESTFATQFRALIDAATYGPRTVSIIQGSNQTTAVGRLFARALVVQVTDYFGKTVAGAQVTFTSPAVAPTGTFGHSTTAVAFTNYRGRAAAPLLRAGSTLGTFSVIASAQFLFPQKPAPFSYVFDSVTDAVFSMRVR